jgi:hypothetical protein
MSVGERIHFNKQEEKKQLKIFSRVFPEVSRVNLNDLMKRAREEEKKTKRNNLVVSVAALSAIVTFGIILTL